MDKVAKVKGVLSAIKNRGTEVMYAQGEEEARRITPTLVESYKMCLSVLKSMDEYKDLMDVVPSLDAGAGIETVVFAAEALLTLLKDEGVEKSPRVSVYALSDGPRSARTKVEKGPPAMIAISEKGGRRSLRKLAGRVRDRLESIKDAMMDELANEQDRWQNEIEILQTEVEKLEDRLSQIADRIEEREEWIEERVERMEERLEERLESLEEMLEEFEEAEEDEEEDDEDEDEDDEDEDDENDDDEDFEEGEEKVEGESDKAKREKRPEGWGDPEDRGDS